LREQSFKSSAQDVSSISGPDLASKSNNKQVRAPNVALQEEVKNYTVNDKVPAKNQLINKKEEIIEKNPSDPERRPS
jgi:hypothetical protein